MRREFCFVDRICDDYFVLKNTLDELYHIDKSYLGELEAGSPALLIYEEPRTACDGYFEVTVRSVFPEQTTLSPLYR